MHHATVAGQRLEYRLIPGDAGKGCLVLLHEGLGSVSLWRDFPDKLARRLGRRALVYSRRGYGGSEGLSGPRTLRFMHDEALVVLPALLDQLGIGVPLLVGHSDGASIALIHAASSGRSVEGLALIAPHVLVESVCVTSIERLLGIYRKGELRERLARHHVNVDDAFLGWAHIWLDPAFRDWSLEPECRALRSPTLLVQGSDDEYGTLAQLDTIERLAPIGVGGIERLVIDKASHAPHRDAEAAVIEAIAGLTRRIESRSRDWT